MKRVLIIALFLTACSKDEPPVTPVVQVNIDQPITMSMSEVSGYSLEDGRAVVWAYGTAVSGADKRLQPAHPLVRWYDTFDLYYANKPAKISLGSFGKLNPNDYSVLDSKQDYLDPNIRVHWLVRDTIVYLGGGVYYDIGVRIGGRGQKQSGLLKLQSFRP